MRFQTQWAIWNFSDLREYSKAKAWIDFFFMLSVLEAKIFQYGFLQEHKMCENNRYWSSM